MSQVIRVVVHGATGKMGQEVLRALAREADVDTVGAVARHERSNRLPVPAADETVLYGNNLAEVVDEARPDVVVDFTSRAAAMEAARVCAARKLHLVTGSSGLSPEDLSEIENLANGAGVGVVVGPNFSTGAVLLLHLVKQAARQFDHAEIIEMHHAGKADAPSGSAIATARAMVAARGADRPFAHPEPHLEPVAGSRGAEIGGIAIHAVRLPGLMAHQQVVFGAPGETLTLRHDTVDRECYMPGVLLAVRAVLTRPGLTYGLGALMDLE